MPLIQVKMLAGVFSPEQKAAMIAKMTDAVVSIQGESFRAVTTVILEEVQSASWSSGGTVLTTEMAKALAAGKS